MTTEILAESDRPVEPATVIETAPAEAKSNSKGSKDFSPEERAEIIAKAKEVGTAKAANEFGIKARLITYWRHQEKKKATKQSKPLKGTTAKGKASKLDRKKVVKDVPTESTEPVESIEPLKPAGRKKNVSAEVPERSDEKQSLIVENAILKERIALLNAEIEKLRTALTSLM